MYRQSNSLVFFLPQGLSAPPANNPFQSEASKLTLNQLSTTSMSSQPTSLPYSASLPLPGGNQPSSLPSSVTHPTQPGLGLLGTLPEPLLPLSSASADGSQSVENNQNPFLWGPMEWETHHRVKRKEKWGTLVLVYNLNCRTASPKTYNKIPHLSCCVLWCNTATHRLMRDDSACRLIELLFPFWGFQKCREWKKVETINSTSWLPWNFTSDAKAESLI